MTDRDPRPNQAPLAHFERLYSKSRDPWDYESSPYEQGKYRATLEALSGLPGRTLELGCSIGVFTEMLAPRCDTLLAVDFSRTAVAEARRRLSDKEWVEVERAMLPEQMPEGPFDTIVCSELLYYWSAPIVREGLQRMEASLADGGSIVAVHWLGRDSRHELDGDQVHRILRDSCGLGWVEGALEPGYVLDVWSGA
jgi:cyclopropane fatty-acyl-phospholipid synthase-like methyltransferase